MYRSVLSWPRQQMPVSGQVVGPLYAPRHQAQPTEVFFRRPNLEGGSRDLTQTLALSAAVALSLLFAPLNVLAFQTTMPI